MIGKSSSEIPFGGLGGGKGGEEGAAFIQVLKGAAFHFSNSLPQTREGMDAEKELDSLIRRLYGGGWGWKMRRRQILLPVPTLAPARIPPRG